MAERIGEFMKI